MERERPILCLKSLQGAFQKSENVSLSRFEWTAIWEIIEPAMKTGNQVRELERELARVKKIATPTWKACERVSRLMAKCSFNARPEKIREWKFYLDQARVVYWQDLPQRLRHRWRDFTGL